MAADRTELRQLATALSQVHPDDELSIYWRGLIVKAGDEIPRLLDQLDAAEARVRELEAEADVDFDDLVIPPIPPLKVTRYRLVPEPDALADPRPADTREPDQEHPDG